MARNLETLWCEAGAHHWKRPRQGGSKPRGCAEHGLPLPAGHAVEADRYLAALKVALDPDEHPEARAAADALMRDLADGMRTPDAHAQEREAWSDGLRDVVGQAFDQRIYGRNDQPRDRTMGWKR